MEAKAKGRIMLQGPLPSGTWGFRTAGPGRRAGTKEKGMKEKYFRALAAVFLAAFLALAIPGQAEAGETGKAVDEKVMKFLGKMRPQWRDLNVPEEDGKILLKSSPRTGTKGRWRWGPRRDTRPYGSPGP